MKSHEQVTLSGTVSDVFAHRFVLRTETGAVLADLGPRGLEMFAPRLNDAVTLSGERKPSEIKVSRIARRGDAAVEITHPKKHGPKHGHGDRPDHAFADPAIARDAAVAAGYRVVGAPRRKPKHFEVLGMKRGSGYVELHIELDGALRKEKPLPENDGKWAADIYGVARPISETQESLAWRGQE